MALGRLTVVKVNAWAGEMSDRTSATADAATPAPENMLCSKGQDLSLDQVCEAQIRVY
jgi:hypothetical protein